MAQNEIIVDRPQLPAPSGWRRVFACGESDGDNCVFKCDSRCFWEMFDLHRMVRRYSDYGRICATMRR